MNDKTRLMIVKIGFLLSFVFYLTLMLTFYVAFFNGGAVIVTLNEFGEMYIEAFVYLPLSSFVIMLALALLFKLKVD
jgi:hypothetical protein